MLFLLLLTLLVVGFVASGIVAAIAAVTSIVGFFAFDAAAGAAETALPVIVASDAATLTIRNLACPVEYAGATYAQDCASPVANLDFSITEPVSLAALTDANGLVIFTDLPAGTYEVTGGPPGEFVQNAIACHPTADPATADAATAIPILPRDNRAIGVTLAGTDITCDWYSIPYDLRGDGEPPSRSQSTTLMSAPQSPACLLLARKQRRPDWLRFTGNQ